MKIGHLVLCFFGAMATLQTTDFSDEDLLKSVLDLETQQVFYKCQNGLSDAQLVQAVETIEES